MNDLQKTNVANLRSLITKQQAQIKLALPKHISPERFARALFTQLQVNPALAKCTPNSVLASTMKAAERGLMPDGRMGALVPFRNNKTGTMDAQFVPMYQGIISLMRQSGEILDVFPATIRENDKWDWELGLRPNLIHKPALSDRGEALAYYAVATFRDGTRSFGAGLMTIEEVEAIRQRSPAKNSGPWVTDFEAMAWKTVIRRNAKYWPQSDELAQVIADEEESDFGRYEVNVTPGAGEGVDAKLMSEAKQRQAKEATVPAQESGGVPGAAAQQEEAPETSGWPRANEDGELVDARGIPWIEAAHSANKTCKENGEWRMKRGADPHRVAQLEAEAMKHQAEEPAGDRGPPATESGGAGFSFETLMEEAEAVQTEEDRDQVLDLMRSSQLTDEQREQLAQVMADNIAAAS